MPTIKLLIFDWEGTLMSTNRQLFPGVAEMLWSLKEKYLLAIATNRYRHSLDRLLKEFHLEGIFQTSRCADETNIKPHPQMLKEILHELDITADEAIMIGDSESDMIMAKNLGMARIAIGASPFINDLSRHGPIHCIEVITQLTTVLSTNEIFKR